MGSGMKCAKALLFFFNLLFFLTGLGLIIGGVILQTKFNAYFGFFADNGFNALAILLICAGVLILLIGFFGCCGAYKENYCMIMTFAVLLCLIFVIEIAAGIAAYMKRSEVENIVQTGMYKSMENYNNPAAAGVTSTWDNIQHDFRCCGVRGYKDWQGKGNLTSLSVPDSCCFQQNNDTSKKSIPNCGRNALSVPTTINSRGCLDGFVIWAKENIYMIGAIGIGLAFIQIVGIMLACCLARSIKKDYEVV